MANTTCGSMGRFPPAQWPRPSGKPRVKRRCVQDDVEQGEESSGGRKPRTSRERSRRVDQSRATSDRGHVPSHHHPSPPQSAARLPQSGFAQTPAGQQTLRPGGWRGRRRLRRSASLARRPQSGSERSSHGTKNSRTAHTWRQTSLPLRWRWSCTLPPCLAFENEKKRNIEWWGGATKEGGASQVESKKGAVGARGTRRKGQL